MALVFGAMTVGQSGSMAPDFGDAKLSANRILKLLDRPSLIDPLNEGGKTLGGAINGRIHFRSVDFAYPTRPNIPVLRQYIHTIPFVFGTYT